MRFKFCLLSADSHNGNVGLLRAGETIFLKINSMPELMTLACKTRGLVEPASP